MNEKLSKFVKDNYPDSKSDLFACFIERCGELLNGSGYQAMITQHAWMFLSSFEKLRGKLQMRELISMAHLGARAFEEIGGEVVQTAAFVMEKVHIPGYKGSYARLIEPTTQDGKEEMYLSETNRYTAQQDNFKKIPGAPIAYWVSERVYDLFTLTLGDVCDVKKGNDTGNNDRYVRCWWEVSINKSDFQLHLQKWIPYIKGGPARKWFGHLTYLVNWNNDGVEIRNEPKATVRNERYFYVQGITWSDVGVNTTTFRYFPVGCLRDNRGPAIFTSKLLYVLGLLNSSVSQMVQYIINPTICFQAGSAKTIPYTEGSRIQIHECENKASNNINLSRLDWNSFETSWDFKKHPMI